MLSGLVPTHSINKGGHGTPSGRAGTRRCPYEVGLQYLPPRDTCPGIYDAGAEVSAGIGDPPLVAAILAIGSSGLMVNV